MAVRITGPSAAKSLVGSDLDFIVGLVNGDEGWARAVALTYSDAAIPTLRLTGLYALAAQASDGSARLAVRDAGVTVSGGLTADDLTVTGLLTLATLTVSGTATFNGAVNLGDNALDAITVTGTPIFLAPSVFKNLVTIENSALTVLASFDTTAGAQKVTLGGAATPGLYVDVANGRTLVGTATAPGAVNDKFQVVGGRTYLSANSEEYALGLRYASSDGTVYVGGSHSATPDMLLSNNNGTQLARLLNGGGLIVGTATAMSGSEKLRVFGAGARLEGATTVLETNSAPLIVLEYGSSSAAVADMRTAYGTSSAPSAVNVAEQVIAGIAGSAYHSGGAYGTNSAIHIRTSESQTNTARGSYVAIMTTAIGTTTLADKVKIYDGVVVGAATGGDKGAGTINVSGNLYKNGTAYANPHGGFERAYTGRLDRYGDRMAAMGLPDYRPLSLEDFEAYTREHFHFPYLGDEEGLGLFDGGERLLLITEELAVHLFSLHHRVRALERRAGQTGD